MLSSVTLKCEDTQLADGHYCQKFLDFSQELKKKKKTLHVLYTCIKSSVSVKAHKNSGCVSILIKFRIRFIP